MNQNNNQVQQSSQVSQEELAKTQVLNLDDVKKIAKYETKTSKRPAILYAIAGVLAITLGLAYPNIMTTLDAETTTLNSTNNREVVETDKVILNKEEENKISCVATYPANPDGTSGIATYNLSFDENDQLQSYSMIITYAQQPGNVDGLVAIQNFYNNYKPLENTTIAGYEISTTYTDTGMQILSTVDLTILNKTMLTDAHQANKFARVPFNLGDSKVTLQQQLMTENYECK